MEVYTLMDLALQMTESELKSARRFQFPSEYDGSVGGDVGRNDGHLFSLANDKNKKLDNESNNPGADYMKWVENNANT